MLRRNKNKRQNLGISPPKSNAEREVITELDNKATLQTSIKWDSTNRDKRERDKIG
jgi:hypothetical protein